MYDAFIVRRNFLKVSALFGAGVLASELTVPAALAAHTPEPAGALPPPASASPATTAKWRAPTAGTATAERLDSGRKNL